MKRVVCLVLAAAFVAGLTACGMEHSNTIQLDLDDKKTYYDSSEKDNTESGENLNTSETKETEAITETFEEEGDASLATESKNAYERFINLQEDVWFDYHTVSGMESGKAYSLDEYLAAKTDPDSPENYAELTVIKEKAYAYIDCGADGIPELTVSLVAEGIMSEYEGDYYYVDVFKYIDGKIQFIYETCEHYRGSSDVNMYGVVFDSFSDYAGANFYTGTLIIDSNGLPTKAYDETVSTGDAIGGIYWGYDGGLNLTDTFPGETDLYDRVYVYNLDIFCGADSGKKLYSYRITDNTLPEENLVDDLNNCKSIEWIEYDEYTQKIDNIFAMFGLDEMQVSAGRPQYISF